MDTKQSGTAEDLIDVLANHTTWQGHAGRIWFGPMLARVILLAGASDLEYVTGSSDETDGCVYAFTKHRVIIARIAGTDLQDAAPRVWTIPRHTLAQVELETDASVLPRDGWFAGDESRFRWPGSLSVIAQCPDGLTLRLPATTDNPDARGRFNSFLPSLLADLDCCHAQPPAP
jgi:hypothetical protein